jgi:hypothetical protein
MSGTRVVGSAERPVRAAQLDMRAVYRAPSGRLCMVQSISGAFVQLVYVRINARGRPAEREDGFTLTQANLWLLKKVH